MNGHPIAMLALEQERERERLAVMIEASVKLQNIGEHLDRYGLTSLGASAKETAAKVRELWK